MSHFATGRPLSILLRCRRSDWPRLPGPIKPYPTLLLGAVPGACGVGAPCRRGSTAAAAPATAIPVFTNSLRLTGFCSDIFQPPGQSQNHPQCSEHPRRAQDCGRRPVTGFLRKKVDRKFPVARQLAPEPGPRRAGKRTGGGFTGKKGEEVFPPSKGDQQNKRKGKGPPRAPRGGKSFP